MCAVNNKIGRALGNEKDADSWILTLIQLDKKY